MEATRETIRPLLDLQRIDSSIDRLTARRANLPEQRVLDEITERRTGAASGHVERQTALDSLVRQQNKLEAEIQQLTDKIEHEQGRLYGGDISNAKELSNIQAELDALRRRKTHLEDQELEIMEQRETAEAEAGEYARMLSDIDAEMAEASARRDAATVEIDGELDRLGAEREKLLPTIPPEALDLYEEVRAKKGGVAIAALEGGVCKGCSLPLSPVAREEIKRSTEPFVRCENCRRLLIPV